MMNYFKSFERRLANYILSKVATNEHVANAVRAATEESLAKLDAELGHAQSTLANLGNLVENQFLAVKQILDQKFADISSEAGFQSLAAETSLLSAGLVARRARLNDPITLPPSNYQPAKPEAFELYLEKLKAMQPAAFEVWQKLFENGRKSYYEQREQSCSHRVHRYAMLFGAYVEVYGFGRMLDVGCGPHGLPSYLATHDPARISGLEPLEPTSAADFECVRGFNEFLPWPDESFHTVLSGTSLDHVLSLEASLAEVRRVLVPKGRYLVWLASISGAKAYDPYSPDLGAIDEFHMFHFDRAWIEPLFEKYFVIDDIKIISQPGFDHVFYCMSKN